MGQSVASPYPLRSPARPSPVAFLVRPPCASRIVLPRLPYALPAHLLRPSHCRYAVATITYSNLGRRRRSLGLSSPRIERRYRSSVTALYVRGFLLASVRRCNCTPTRSRGSRRSPTPRAFLVRVEAELPGRVSSTTRERRQRRLQVASSRPRRVRGAGLRELNVIDAAAVASYY